MSLFPCTTAGQRRGALYSMVTAPDAALASPPPSLPSEARSRILASKDEANGRPAPRAAAHCMSLLRRGSSRRLEVKAVVVVVAA